MLFLLLFVKEKIIQTLVKKVRQSLFRMVSKRTTEWGFAAGERLDSTSNTARESGRLEPKSRMYKRRSGNGKLLRHLRIRGESG